MKQETIKNLIEKLLKEHEENEFCTSYDEAIDSDDIFCNAYNVGRYEALNEVLKIVQKITNERDV